MKLVQDVDLPQKPILKIEKEHKRYRVYFDFSPIPISMNDGYLETILKDLKTNKNIN